MIAFIPARRRKETAAFMPRPCRQPHHRRYTAWLLSLVLCLNSIAPAVATVHEVLTATVIGQDLALEPQFEKTRGGLHGYRARGYLASAEASGYYGLADFYRRLKREHRAALGPPRRIRLPFEDMALTVPVYSRFRYLGTPFVQSRYLRRQINRLLRRTLIDADRPGFGSEREQTRTLYDNAFAFARANPTLRLGVALPHSRIDAPVDMIWPEQRNLQGETLLVPVLYLTRATWEARRVEEPAWTFNGPAHIDRLNLERATLTTGRAAWIEAVNGITLNGGQILSSGDLTLVAGGAFTNLSGQVVVEGDLTVVAQRIENRTLVYRFERGGNVDERYGAIAAIEAGNVTFRSFSDIVMAGAEIHAGQDIRFAADGNIYVGPVPLNRRQLGRDGHWHEHSQTHVHYLRSRLSAKDSIRFIAGGNIVIDAADIVAERGHIELLADYGISVVDSLAESHYQRKGTFGQASVEEEAYKTVAMRALLDAGKGLVIHSTLGDITLKSARIRSGDGARVQADQGKIHLLVTRETDHYRYSEVKEDLFTARTIDRGQEALTALPTTIVGGLSANALYGVHVEYAGVPGAPLDEQLAAFRQIPGLAWMADVRAQLPDADWTAIENQYRSWQHDNTSLSPGFAAAIAITVAIASQGMANNFANSLLTGLVNQGSLHGALQAAIAAGTVSALSQAAVVGANGLANGDLGAAMESLVSSDSLRNVVTAMLTAGVLKGIDTDLLNIADNATLSLVQQAEQALYHAVAESAISTLIHGGDFGDWGDSIVRGLAQFGVNTLGQVMTQTIGDAAKQQRIHSLVRYLSHAATGCIIGFGEGALNDDMNSNDYNCASGAGGALIGELVGDIYKNSAEFEAAQAKMEDWFRTHIGEVDGLPVDWDNLTTDQFQQLMEVAKGYELSTGAWGAYNTFATEYNTLRQHGINLSRLSAAMAAALAGADVNIADSAADNAATNNAFAFLAPVLKWGLIGTSAYYTVEEAHEAAKAIEELIDVMNHGTEAERRDALYEIAQIIGLGAAEAVFVKKAETLTGGVEYLLQKAKGTALGEKLGDYLNNIYDGVVNNRAIRKIGCFVAGTPVLTREGYKPIESIKVGDEVASRSAITGVIDWQPVKRRITSHKRPLWLTFEDDKGVRETLGVTREHPFRQGSLWRVAGLLKVGDTVTSYQGRPLTLVHKREDSVVRPAYNLEVAHFQSYVVGRLAFWVHNDCYDAIEAGLKNIAGLTDKVRNSLMRTLRNKDIVDQDIIDFLQDGRFNDARGYHKVLEALRQNPVKRASGIQALRRGEQLRKEGKTVGFEDDGVGYDIDVGEILPNGEWGRVYALKTNTLKQTKKRLESGGKQIRSAPGTKKFVEMKLTDANKADFLKNSSYRYLINKFPEDYPNITVIIEFADGRKEQWY